MIVTPRIIVRKGVIPATSCAANVDLTSVAVYIIYIRGFQSPTTMRAHWMLIEGSLGLQELAIAASDAAAI